MIPWIKSVQGREICSGRIADRVEGKPASVLPIYIFYHDAKHMQNYPVFYFSLLFYDGKPASVMPIYIFYHDAKHMQNYHVF